MLVSSFKKLSDSLSLSLSNQGYNKILFSQGGGHLKKTNT